MVPAHQRLEAGDRAILEAHDRLEDDPDLVAVDRLAQIGDERAAGPAVRCAATA